MQETQRSITLVLWLVTMVWNADWASLGRARHINVGTGMLLERGRLGIVPGIRRGFSDELECILGRYKVGNIDHTG